MESPTAEAVTPTPPADEEMAPADAPTQSASPPPVDRADSPAPALAAARVEPVIDIEAEAAKKRRQAVLQDETKKRGKRMFGVMLGALNQAKKETSKLSSVTKKRQEVDERLHAKLTSERAELEEKRQLERDSKDLKIEVIKREEEILTAESIYHTRHAAKLHLASFLCTTFTLPPPPPSSDGITVPYAPRIPHALRVTNPTAPKPIYYLPYRLLPFQEDQIEDQVANVKKNIRLEREKWDDLKGIKVSDLTAAKRKRDATLEEVERAEREARQKRRREDDEFEERARAKAKLDNAGAMDVDGGNRGRNGSANGVDPVTNGIKREEGVHDDVARGHADDDAMDAADSGPRSGSRAPTGDVPVEGGRMEVEGEGDELEY